MLKKVSKLFSHVKVLYLLALIGILFVTAVHFINLGNSPIGINHDELEVMLSAKTGLPFPQALFYTDTEAGIAALPSLLMSLYFKVVPLNLVSARFLYSVLNLATGVILSLIILKLTSKKPVAIISYLVFMISPWSFAYSRALTEAPFALLFLLLGVFLLYSFSGKKIYFSLLSFLAAFFSYQGTKIIIPVLVLGFVFLHYKFVNKTQVKNYLIYIATFISIIGMYFVLVFTLPQSTVVSRSPEFIFLNLDRYSEDVNESRMQLLDTPISNLFINKYFFMVKEFIGKYIGVYSPKLLFMTGDPRSTYTFGEHGLLYFIDFIFLIAGIIGISRLKNKMLGFTVLMLAIFAPIGSAISLVEDSYIFRSGLMIPVFVILITFGIYFTYQSVSQKFKPTYILFVCIAYLFLIVNFFHIFFASFPIKQQENQYFSERVLVSYLHRASSYARITAVVNSPLQITNQYEFFYGEMPENVVITNKCTELSGMTVIQSSSNCEMYGNYLTIQDSKDAGSLYKIYHDGLCYRVALSQYNRYHYFSDYNVENLSNNEFCTRLIHKY